MTYRAWTLSSLRHQPCVYGHLAKGHQSFNFYQIECTKDLLQRLIIFSTRIQWVLQDVFKVSSLCCIKPPPLHHSSSSNLHHKICTILHHLFCTILHHLFCTILLHQFYINFFAPHVTSTSPTLLHHNSPILHHLFNNNILAPCCTNFARTQSIATPQSRKQSVTSIYFTNYLFTCIKQGEDIGPKQIVNSLKHPHCYNIGPKRLISVWGIFETRYMSSLLWKLQALVTN